MDREEIFTLWKNYIEELFKYARVVVEIPYIYSSPHCATCAHWKLFGEDELETISYESKDLSITYKYERICEGMKGNLHKVLRYSADDIDTCNFYRFFGFCKRYPPLSHDYGPFVIKPKPLWRGATRFIFEYRFPITDQEQWCGEWKRGPWYWCEKEFILERCKGEDTSDIKEQHLKQKFETLFKGKW